MSQQRTNNRHGRHSNTGDGTAKRFLSVWDNHAAYSDFIIYEAIEYFIPLFLVQLKQIMNLKKAKHNLNLPKPKLNHPFPQLNLQKYVAAFSRDPFHDKTLESENINNRTQII